MYHIFTTFVRNIIYFIIFICKSQYKIDRPFVDRFIEKIIVYPERQTMRLKIHLYNGQTINNMLDKSKGRSGHTMNFVSSPPDSSSPIML